MEKLSLTTVPRDSLEVYYNTVLLQKKWTINETAALFSADYYTVISITPYCIAVSSGRNRYWCRSARLSLDVLAVLHVPLAGRLVEPTPAVGTGHETRVRRGGHGRG